MTCGVVHYNILGWKCPGILTLYKMLLSKMSSISSTAIYQSHGSLVCVISSDILQYVLCLMSEARYFEMPDLY